MKKQSVAASRRSFLKTGMVGAAGAVLVPGIVQGAGDTEQAPPGRKRIFRTLGRTGIRIPLVSMGAQAQDPAVYSAALDNGVTHLDTANSYGRGRHEEMLAGVIKGRKRDSLIIATKVHMPIDHKTGLFITPGKPAVLRQRVEESLKRLQLEYVDILYLHDVVKGEAVAFEPYMNELVKLRREGKTRFIGITTHTREPEVIRATVAAKVYDVVLTAYNFRQPHRAEVQSAIAAAASAGLGVVAMKTQAGVFWDQQRKQPINMGAALKWVLNDTNVHTAIPGFSTFAEMETDLGVMRDLALSAAEEADLRLKDAAGLPGLYCDQCGGCLAQCADAPDIPTLMRAYMYAYGYRNAAKARQTLEGVVPGRLACTDCESCRVRCTMGFDLKERILAAARLAAVPFEMLV